LKLFTLLSDEEIGAIMENQVAEPAMRVAQIRLAQEVTALVHGHQGLENALAESDAKFKGLNTGSVRATHVTFDGRSSVASALVDTGQATSMRDARQLISEGAISLNEKKIFEDKILEAQDLIDGRIRLQKGKKSIEFIEPELK